MHNITVRKVDLKDAQRLLEIYSYYVKNTAVSFEWKVPSADEFRRRIENTLSKYPFFCVLRDGKFHFKRTVVLCRLRI